MCTIGLQWPGCRTTGLVDYGSSLLVVIASAPAGLLYGDVCDITINQLDGLLDGV